MIRILVVGQTPPPFHGQAVMVQNLVEAPPEGCRVAHVRMHFSAAVAEIGRISLRKLLHQVGLIFRIAVARLRHGSTILYYVPGGPTRAAVLRDIVTLLTTRWMFRSLVLHIHAGGISEYVSRQPRLIRALHLSACGDADAVIELSEFAPPDARFLHARRRLVIPNGIPDGSILAPSSRTPHPVPRVLYVGALLASKGLHVLLDACRRLRDEGLAFHLDLVGEFADEPSRRDATEFISRHRLSDVVHILGVLTGTTKRDACRDADVFCFPSFYEAEGVPLAVLEAMQFSLPVVATRWRGIPLLVADAETGLLVPPNDASALAEGLGRMLRDPVLRKTMGDAGRRRYEAHFTLDPWRQRMAAAFLDVASGAGQLSRPTPATPP